MPLNALQTPLIQEVFGQGSFCPQTFLFGDDFDFLTHRTNDAEGFEHYVTRVLKLLGDDRKFEILSYIRDKEAYGSELAKHLNLTTATVSHHMNALMAAGLVEIKRIDTRIYYTANKEILKDILERSKKLLIGWIDFLFN